MMVIMTELRNPIAELGGRRVGLDLCEVVKESQNVVSEIRSGLAMQTRSRILYGFKNN